MPKLAASKPATPPMLSEEQDAPAPPQDGFDKSRRSVGTKAGMAISAVGGAVAGYQYGGIIGGLFGLSAGSSVATDISNANVDTGSAVLAGGVAVGAVALGGHLGGVLGVIIGGACAAGAAKFVLE